MEKEKQIEQLRLAAEILEKGLEWEVFCRKEYDEEHWHELHPSLLMDYVGAHEIRIKPKPPEENKFLKAFKEGKEVQWKPKRHTNSGLWLAITKNRPNPPIGDPDYQWRILTTREVPLTYDDVMPGMVVRDKDCKDKQLITIVQPDKVYLSNYGPKSYHQLVHFKRWTGTEWLPCTKTVEEVEE